MSDYRELHRKAGLPRLASPWAAPWVALVGRDAAPTRSRSGPVTPARRGALRAVALPVLVALIAGIGVGVAQAACAGSIEGLERPRSQARVAQFEQAQVAVAADARKCDQAAGQVEDTGPSTNEPELGPVRSVTPVLGPFLAWLAGVEPQVSSRGCDWPAIRFVAPGGKQAEPQHQPVT